MKATARGIASPLRRSIAIAAAGLLIGGSAPSTDQAPALDGDVVMRLISAEQYRNAMKDVFGANIGGGIRLPPLRRADGLVALGATHAEVSPGTLSYFQNAATKVAAEVVSPEQRAALLPCEPKDPSAPDDRCARQFLSQVGHLLFRRPLAKAELAGYLAIAHASAKQAGSFYDGVGNALVGLLMAPQFIYLTEHVEPDPAARDGLRLDGPSKAIRLSLLLWNAPPDAELLHAAEAGELDSRTGLARQVDRLITSPRLEEGVRAFFSDMLLTELFDDLSKDRTIYSAATTRAMLDGKEQMLRIVADQLLARRGDYRDLFTTRNIFLTRSLATLYRTPVTIPSSADWIPYQLPDDGPRAGLLSQIGFLSAESHPGRSSATKRGRAIREVFMCQPVPNPPPNVDFSALENPDPNNKTARQRLSAHAQSPACAGCHKLTDPLGLSLENFDGAGQFRTLDNGALIDPSGSLGGDKFADARGLGQALHDSRAVPACLTQKLVQYGMGRPLSKDDRPFESQMETRFAQSGYRFVDLMRAMVLDEGFFKVRRNATAVAKTQIISQNSAG